MDGRGQAQSALLHERFSETMSFLRKETKSFYSSVKVPGTWYSFIT